MLNTHIIRLTQIIKSLITPLTLLITLLKRGTFI